MSKPSPARYRTVNWSSYNAALCQRGSLLIWVDKDMTWLAPRDGRPGRPAAFSDSAIQFCLSIKGEGRSGNDLGDRFSLEMAIAHRPKIIGERDQFGHWECDLVMFRKEFGKANVTSLVERLSRFAVVLKNTNNRLRRYLPRNSDPTAFTNRYLRSTCDRLNATPRKCLGYQTPAEVFRTKLMEGPSST